ETTQYAGPISPVITHVTTVNGAAIDPGEYGLDFNPPVASWGLAPTVVTDAAGNPVVGFHPAGLVAANVMLPYAGMSFDVAPGDLTVEQRAEVALALNYLWRLPAPANRELGEMCAFRGEERGYEGIVALCGGGG